MIAAIINNIEKYEPLPPSCRPHPFLTAAQWAAVSAFYSILIITNRYHRTLLNIMERGIMNTVVRDDVRKHTYARQQIVLENI